ncbi:MAG: hypothetical protein ABI813_07695 [Bacteroidota bacterium]
MKRGYRSVKEVVGTKIILSETPGRQRNVYEKQLLYKGLKRRATIEPQLGKFKIKYSP